MQTKEFAWGVCNDDMGHNYASTSGNFKAISLSSPSFEGGMGARGEWGCQIQSVINEHLKDLTVAAKMFKFIIMF